MKIWNTKYCLTDGITEHDVPETSRDMVVITKTEISYSICLHGQGKEWHRTLKGAIARAEEVRIKKLKSLDRSIKKISAINFEA